MAENVFIKHKKDLTLEEYMSFSAHDRGNLGMDVPVLVYRLLEFSLKEQLKEQYGAEEQIRIFRAAGYRAGEYFVNHILDLSLPQNEFLVQLQLKLEEMRIGVLRIEKFDEESGKMVLTISEDADCSGLPLLGETVCNYDEGFIAGVLSTYLGKAYTAIEIDCWATGDRVCRFQVEPGE